MSWLATFGKDFKAVFAWIGTPKGQGAVGLAEAVAATAYPGATPVLNLVNAWASLAIVAGTRNSPCSTR